MFFRLGKGIGFGAVFAYRGLTYAIAPFAFGYLYKLFENGIPYGVAALMTFTALPVIFGPLRRELNRREAEKALFFEEGEGKTVITKT